MTPETNVPARARVSIIERLIPSVSYLVAAAAGAIGGVRILSFLESVRNSEIAERDAFFLYTARIELAMGTVLAVSAIIGAIAIAVSVVRMFTVNKTASPPGVLFLLLGPFALVPPFLVHFVLHLVEHIAQAQIPEGGGMSAIAGTVSGVSYAAIILALLVAVVQIAFSFIPFTANLRRKFSPMIFLIFNEILIIALAGVFFWQARQALEHTAAGLLG